MNATEDFQRINIRRRHVFRRHVFSDTLRAFSKPSFNVGKLLKVKFIGEVALDENFSLC